MENSVNDKDTRGKAVFAWLQNFDCMGLGLLGSFFLMCFNPGNCLHKEARKELGYTIL